MSQPAPISSVAAPASSRTASRNAGAAIRPFAGLIDPILVDEPVLFTFPGSLGRDAAMAAWTWAVRDTSADLVSLDGVFNGALTGADFEPVATEVALRMRAGLEQAGKDPDAARRLKAQMARDDHRELLVTAISALRHRSLLAKAQAFGKATNAITDDAALQTALQSMPLKDPQLAALLFQAAVGKVANPARLITAVIKLAGGATDAAIGRAGFSPMVDAYLAHAQNQLHNLQLLGPFADFDLVCRSLDRFHRLVRALTGYIEFSRGSRATQVLSALTKHVSDRVEPRLKEVAVDVNQALRRPREGADRLDDDRLLAAVNGVYLLSAVRDSRDSLALNAVFDQAWSQTGQALEMHAQRIIEHLRQAPGDALGGARMDATIKMAEIRFNADYAETLRRARVAAERRS